MADDDDVVMEESEAIQAARKALKAEADCQADRVRQLRDLANLLFAHPVHDSLNMDNLEEAIMLKQRAVELTPQSEHEAADLIDLAELNFDRYRWSQFCKQPGAPYLDAAIKYQRDAINLCLEDQSKAYCLKGLSDLLFSRHKRTRMISQIEDDCRRGETQQEYSPDSFNPSQDLEESITILRDAIHMLQEDNPDRPTWLLHKGALFDFRFHQHGDVEDLEEAVNLTRQACQAIQVVDMDFSSQLSVLLVARYTRMGQSSDIEEAIALDRDILQISSSHEWFFSVRRLSNALFQSYKQTKEMESLDEAISYAMETLGNAKGRVQVAGAYNLVYHQLFERHQTTGDASDLDDLIEIARSRVDSVPTVFFRDLLADWWYQRVGISPHSSDLTRAIETPGCIFIDGSTRVTSLDDFSDALLLRYQKMGKTKDLVEAIDAMRRLIKLMMRPSYLLKLGSYLFMLYEEEEDDAVANEVSWVSRQLGPDLESSNSPYQCQYLTFKAAELSLRFRTLGSVPCLEEAIKTGTQVTQMLSAGCNDRAKAFDDLGSMTYQMFCATRDQSHLDNALRHCKQASDLMSDHDINYGHCLTRYSSYSLERYRLTRSQDDLDEAVRAGRQAVVSSSNGVYMQERILDNLANALYQRHLVTGTLQDLEEAVGLSRQAVDLKLEDPINGCPYFFNLAAMLCELHTLSTGQEALHHLTQALQLVDLARNTGDACEKPHPNLARIMCYCTPSNFACYMGMATDNVQSHIQRYRNIVQGSDEMPCSDRALHTSSLVLLLSYAFAFGEPADMDEPVKLGREAIELAQDDDHLENMPWHTCALAVALGSRFSVTRNPEDLVEAIDLGKCALEMAAQDDPHRPFYLIIWSWGYYARYSYTGRLHDLYQSIHIGSQAWSLSSVGSTVGDYRNQILCAANLACYLNDRYLREGQTLDFEKAIQFRQEANNRLLTLRKDECINLYDRYMGTRHANSVSDVSTLETPRLSPRGISESPARLYNLSAEILQCYTEEHEAMFLSQAVFLSQCSVRSTPYHHPSRVARLELLGRCFHLRYGQEKAVHTPGQGQHASSSTVTNDLDGALDSLQQVLDIADEEDALWQSALHLVGPLYCDRYRLSGDIGDLRMGLIALEESVRTSTNDTALLSARLRHLGAARMDNFALFNRMADLDLSKTHFQEAIDNITHDCASKAGCLLDLAAVYQADYNKTRRRENLDTSLELYDRAHEVLKSLHGHPQLQEYLSRAFSGRGLSYLERYKDTKIPLHLDKCIQDMKESLMRLSTNISARTIQLINIADAHIAGYVATQDTAHLAAASQRLQEAVDGMKSAPLDNVSTRVSMLHTIGSCYRAKYGASKLVPDLEAAISFLDEAFELSPLDTTGDLARLILIAQGLVSALTVKKDWDRAYLVVSRAVPLIAATTPRFLDISESQFLLSKYSNLASMSAALAMSAGREPMEAIQILEAGRGVSMLALNELRSDLSTLRSMDDDQRERLLALRTELEGSAYNPVRDKGENTQRAGEALRKAAQHVRAGRELTKLVRDQHSRTHQMAFTDKIKSVHLAQASLGGAIIVVNVSYRCDAFLIRGPLTQSLSLPELSRETIQDRVREGNFTSEQVLEWLWDTIASPVLEALGHAGPPQQGAPWPRIWWIPTGPLSKFPLHAAGRHLEEKCFNSTIDRVISSYSVSIRGLEESISRSDRSARNKTKKENQAQQALVIAMDHTPNMSKPLHFACAEAEVVTKACERMSVKAIRRDRCTKEMVLSHIQDSDIFHFAGHGCTDSTDPSRSHLRLQDWESNPLTVGDLITINLRERTPFLAYLGACGTGEIQDAKHLDESVHLISACQLAGFLHVIGTLCEVNDKTCVDIARITYQVIREKGLTGDSVSEGLHHAVRKLRDNWRQDKEGPTWTVTVRDSISRDEHPPARSKDTMNDVVRDASPYDSDEDDCKSSPLQWAPYVHYGC
ncbi:hypothetical protein F66182_6053 [Fusarium sp. NRRL 66182]|nr:hypothetical protein F66182_6053 [Fusarium sp. NRRL 66182]